MGCVSFIKSFTSQVTSLIQKRWWRVCASAAQLYKSTSFWNVIAKGNGVGGNIFRLLLCTHVHTYTHTTRSLTVCPMRGTCPGCIHASPPVTACDSVLQSIREAIKSFHRNLVDSICIVCRYAPLCHNLPRKGFGLLTDPLIIMQKTTVQANSGHGSPPGRRSWFWLKLS